MPIYTKKGDNGKTSTLDSKSQISKSDQRIVTIGSIDELNTLLGVAYSFSEDKVIKDDIKIIQENLFNINSVLAGAKIRFTKTNTTYLEKRIDTMTDQMPKLKNFIFPGGSRAGALLHNARSIARRAERELSKYLETEKVKPQIVEYMNRLSDFLFTAARWTNFASGNEEQIWRT